LVMIQNSGTVEMLFVAVAALIVLFAMTIWALRKSMKPADFGAGELEDPVAAQ